MAGGRKEGEEEVVVLVPNLGVHVLYDPNLCLLERVEYCLFVVIVRHLWELHDGLTLKPQS